MNYRDLPGPGDCAGSPLDPRAPAWRGEPPEVEPLDSPVISKLIDALCAITDDLWEAREKGDIEMARCAADRAARVAIEARRKL